MTRLRAEPPTRLGGVDVTVDRPVDTPRPNRTDALIFTGGRERESVRVAVRPSGTEPKIKCYIEIRVAPLTKCPPPGRAPSRFCRTSPATAEALLQRGPN